MCAPASRLDAESVLCCVQVRLKGGEPHEDAPFAKRQCLSNCPSLPKPLALGLAGQQGVHLHQPQSLGLDRLQGQHLHQPQAPGLNGRQGVSTAVQGQGGTGQPKGVGETMLASVRSATHADQPWDKLTVGSCKHDELLPAAVRLRAQKRDYTKAGCLR